MTNEKSRCLPGCTFVILGGTGDLSKRKLIPAIYKLIADKRICTYSLVLISFSPTTAQEILDQARAFIHNIDETVWKNLVAATYYHQMDFHNETAYKLLHHMLHEIEQKHGLMGNRIFYLATMPHHFEVITKNFAHYGIVGINPASKWARVVYEKPFGHDLASAKSLNNSITQAFCEQSVFRIDHYLGKELVGNIALARFTNRVFEPLWSHEHIESVHILLSETLGVENRGAYYDNYGALKDMVQSHMLQMLALVAMEAPKHLAAEYFHTAKGAVLKNITVEDAVFGQYDGYRSEPAVKPNSLTDTFVALRLKINNPRWQGVPFYVTTGKCMDKTESSIVIKFKPAKCLLDLCPATTNTLTINIAPREGFYLGLNVKSPGFAYQVQPVSMDFCHSCLFGPNTPEAYEVLLTDVIKGDQAAFLHADEIELAWKIIAQVQALNKPIHFYKKGSSGPVEAEKL